MKHDQNDVVAYLLDCQLKSSCSSEPLLDINAVNEAWQTSLTMAAVNNNLETVERLIAAGADVNVRDKVCQILIFELIIILLSKLYLYSKVAVPPTGQALKVTTKCSPVSSNQASTLTFVTRTERRHFTLAPSTASSGPQRCSLSTTVISLLLIW